MISSFLNSFKSFWRTRLKPLVDAGKYNRKVAKWIKSIPDFQTLSPVQKHLIIIRPDDIGDYILFRQSLERIRKGIAFSDWKITLVGNLLWKDLAIYLDKDFVDDWIWLDKKLWFKEASYRFSFFESLRTIFPAKVWIPARTRHFFLEDTLALAFQGIPVLASGNAFCSYQTQLEREWIDKVNYQHLLVSDPDTHERVFNREVCSLFLNELNHIPFSEMKLPAVAEHARFEGIGKNYIVLFPGASAASKRWPTAHFSEILSILDRKTNCQLILAGSGSDAVFAEEILQKSANPKRILNFCGKTSLPELLYLLKKAKLLLSNDTSAAHMAAALGTPTIVVCNGNKFGRFFPYPQNYQNVNACFPSPNIEFNFGGRYSIGHISPETVLKLCLRALGK